MPDDFLRQDLKDTLIAIGGYYDERIDDERIARRLGLMVVSPYADKSFDIYKFWEIAGDEEILKQSKQHQRSTLLEKLRQHKLEEQQKKQNATD